MITIEKKLYSKMPPELQVMFQELPNPERDKVLEGFPNTKTHGGGASSTGFWQGGQDKRFIDKGDSGSAARFFYCAKASKAERGNDNNHPTVKPIKLMRYLCRLITPPKGIVLDNFAGSGSTGVASIIEGFQFIGMELSPESCAIGNKRIEHERQQLSLPLQYTS